MKYKLTHKTSYIYTDAIHNYQCIVCLHPITSERQNCEDFKLTIEPNPQNLFERKDYFGNTQYYFSILKPHKVLQVIATSIIEVFPPKLLVANSITCAEALHLFSTKLLLKNELLQFQLPSPFIFWNEEIKLFAQTCLAPNESLYESIAKLSEKIFTEFEFNSGATTINTPLSEVLKLRKGVCQDFTHLMIACVRSLGFAARYVSGYLETLPPKGKVKLQGSDASHAWVSVYVPEMGWCEFDPTNSIISGERHIVTAYGRDYSDISPLKGIIFSSGEHKVKVEVDVIPIL
ncbi:transglutaminase domain-containing protein [Flavobacterium sp. ACAM 123]|jgi:transglutaminase-like putative cysteine protease|uniref:transglutaminase family protein n=1 Tax=Flavobacterium sp. ACAM 123 TaxID=1189620 RepID=UPI00030D9492|nr:transglutaminase family protein [Flavobacterium sp. ACAM 123]